jgi:hypothetical protein
MLHFARFEVIIALLMKIQLISGVMTGRDTYNCPSHITHSVVSHESTFQGLTSVVKSVKKNHYEDL